MRDQDELEVFRRHGAEGVLLLGGGAALLLQLADPRIAHGVVRHSDFRSRPLDRLFGTLDYIYAVGFGDDETVRAAVRAVNAAHVPVRAAAGEGRPAYSAFDADAQRWVASTLAAVALDLRERLWGPVDEATGDAIVRGYAAVGQHLQATREGWPETRAEFEAWWADRAERLAVGDEARAVARALLSRQAGFPAGATTLLAPVRLLTAALLPAAVREAYGFRWTARTERVANGWLRGIGVVWLMLPRAVRHAPMRASLRRTRRRIRYAGLEHRGRR